MTSRTVICPHCEARDTFSTNFFGAIECDCCGQFFVLRWVVSPDTTPLYFYREQEEPETQDYDPEWYLDDEKFDRLMREYLLAGDETFSENDYL